MNQRYRRKLRRTGSVFLVAILMVNIIIVGFAGATGTGNIGGTINYLANEDLAPGIHYSEEDHVNYGGVTVGGNTYDPHRVRFNHLSIDLNKEGVRLTSAKAQDTVNARETVGKMAVREATRGNNVVAAINADPYDMDFGINCGIQVQNGNILISEPSLGYTTNDAPAFYVDESGAHIDPLRTVLDITSGEHDFTVTTLNRNSFGSWYGDPNKITSDTLRIFTSNITEGHTMTHYREDTNPLPDNHVFALLKLDNFSGMIHAGTEYTGTVAHIYDDEGFTIPDDCIVLAGYEGDADGVHVLQEGDAVSFSGNLYTGSYTTDANGCIDERGDLDNTVNAAVNGYHLLAKDGVVNSEMVDNQGTDINSRTVIGIKADGTIEVLCANKPGCPDMDNSLTTGTTFKEIAQYMVNDLGCMDVLNMDGGGSTEMVARRAGSDALTTVSYPSDGTSRLISNTLLFISDAPRTASVGQVVVDNDINIYQGSGYQFSYRLTDQSGSAMSTVGKQVTWKAEYGTIDQDGNYVAPSQVTTDTITATVDGISGTATAQVVDSSAIAAIGLTDTGTIALKQGNKHQFGFSAQNSTQSNIVISPSLAEWSIDADVGMLDSDGLLTVTAATGSGIVSCSFLGHTYSVSFVIGLEEQIIDDFEGGAHRADAYEINSRYIYPNHKTYWGGDGNNMVGVETDTTKVKSGSQSLYMVYDTTDWPRDPNTGTRTSNGTLNLFPFWDGTSADYGQGTDTEGDSWTEENRAALEDSYTAKAMPKKFGLWVYSGDENGDGVSDNYDCMATCFFKTNCQGPGTGSSASLKITPDEHIDWIGWKWVEVDVPQTWEMPITFNYMMVSNINKALPDSQNYRTTIMLDDLKYIYTDDIQDNDGPVFSNTIPVAGGVYKDNFKFSTVITDVLNQVDPSTITVAVNDAALTDYTFDQTSGLLKFTESNLTDGETLRIVVKAKDTKGNDSVPYIDNTYTVDLQEDTDAPVISQVTPSNSAVVRIPSPRIGFMLKDAKSGVDPDTIDVELDGRKLTSYYDSDSGWGYAQPEFTLDKGSYSLTIDASDKAGNAINTYNDTLSIDPIGQPSDPENYRVAVMPDSQGNAYSAEIYDRMVQENPDFIIHTGDIVDGTGEDEYIEGKQLLDNTGVPYLTIPGNHEGGGMNLNYYYKYFGSPTYTFDYGCTRFIGLNSAYNQSIETTDPTQYPYLQEMLDNNTKSNIVIYNHVITQDPYYTEHNMTDAEAAEFEGILSAYKAAHPNVNITVLFGHLHTLASWRVGGVNYIIDGNAAGKGYVTQDQGNFLGSGILEIKNGVSQYKYEPIPSKIYIKHAALTGSSLTAVQGASLQLDLYGDFHDSSPITNASVNYLTQINDDAMVDIAWSSSNPEVASVSDTGVVTVNDAGQAEVTAVCGGRTFKITVNAMEQADLQVSKLMLSLPKTTTVGRTLVPSAVATDPYGSTVAVKLTGGMLTVSPKGILVIHDDGTLIASNSGEAVVSVSFGGKTAEASITVQRPFDGDNDDKDNTPQTTPVLSDNGKNVNMKIDGKTDSGAATSVELSSQEMKNILEKAKNGEAGLTGLKVIELSVNSNVSTKTIALNMPAKEFKNITDNTDADIKVNTGVGSISFDAKASECIANDNSTGSIQINISKQSASMLTEQTRMAIGDKPVYSLIVKSGDKKITDFDGGIVTVSVPYTLSADENPNKIVIYYISNENSLIPVPTCKYDAETNTVTFETSHFSNYAVGYNDISFSDVSGWYQDYVDFLAARKIINGTGDGKFAPDANITRAEFVTILANLSGESLSSYKTSMFSDVSSSDWYAEAVGWTYTAGIAEGFNGKFSPDSNISRQDIAVMVMRYVKKYGNGSLPSSNDRVIFKDNDDIAAYASDAVTKLQRAGIIAGTDNGHFAPGENATRAQASKIVAVLLQTLIG